MTHVWNNARKDLWRRFRDPVGLIVWIGIPFVMLSLLTLAFGAGEVKPQAHLLVADEDDSFLSGLLVGAFGQGPLTELVRVEPVAQGPGRERIEAGQATALLIIPAGFGQAVLAERPTRLELITNPAQTILPGILEEVLSMIVDATFYAQRLLGAPLREIAAGPPAGQTNFSDATIAGLSVTVNQSITRLSGLLFPPLLELVSNVDAQPESRPNLGTLFFAGMFFMALFLMAQGLSDDVWSEKAEGTLRRVVTTPSSTRAWLAGKLLAGAILFGGLGLVALFAGSWIFGLPLSPLPLAIVWATSAATVFFVMFMLIQLHATSQRAGSLLTSFITFPLLLLGGSFFPFAAMPDWLAAVGRWTPNGWALVQFTAILDGTLPVARLSLGLLGLAGAGSLLYAWSLRRLRRFI